MYADIGSALDPDARYSNRKPQYNSEPDPHWRAVMHASMGDGQWGRYWRMRGNIQFAAVGAGAYVLSRYGWVLHSGLSDGIIATGPTFWPNLTRGSFVICFLAGWASASPPQSHTCIGSIHNVTAGDFLVQFGTTFSGSFSFGWYNNGTDSRVLSVSPTGLWASGDLVTIGFSYSPKGTQAYVKGKQVGSTATVPATFDKSNTANTKFGIGIDGTTGFTGWGSDIISFTVLDRELDAREWGWIHQNPLNWLFAPGLIANMITPGVAAAPSSNLQTAVSM